jgi:putative hydrolase of the HAD superfamily
MNSDSFDALLFDLGGVVIDFDFQRAFARWAETTSCDAAHLRERFSRDQAFKLHETGRLTDEAYFESLRMSLGINISNADFLDGWNAIFVGEMPGISGLLAKVAMNVPLYAFTNTNRAHHLYWSRHLANFVSHFKEIFLSYKIGLRKPDAEAFQFVVEAIGVPAERILFFDDVLANIEGARACGLQAVHVTTRSTVPEILARMAV